METKTTSKKTATPWYDKGLCFECTGCGSCCTGGPGYVWISDEEVGRLAKHLGISIEETLARYCRKAQGQVSLKEFRNQRGEYDCVFLKEVPPTDAEKASGKVVQAKRICEIYAVRPLQCRTFPFWDGVLMSPGSWDRAAARCPGINQGKRHTVVEMEARRDAKDWPKN